MPLKPKLKVQKRNLKPSPQLMALLGRMDNRAWREQMLIFTAEYIRESAYELRFIQHLRSCEECRLIAQLDVERYLGTRSIWFLNIQNDIAQDWDEDEINDPDWKDYPRAENYRIGSYWTGSSDDTLRFIDDRTKWADRIIRKKMLLACQYYKKVKAWDLNGEAPFEPELAYLCY